MTNLISDLSKWKDVYDNQPPAHGASALPVIWNFQDDGDLFRWTYLGGAVTEGDRLFLQIDSNGAQGLFFNVVVDIQGYEVIASYPLTDNTAYINLPIPECNSLHVVVAYSDNAIWESQVYDNVTITLYGVNSDRKVLVPFAVSSQLDDNGQERIHISPTIVTVIAAPPIPPVEYKGLRWTKTDIEVSSGDLFGQPAMNSEGKIHVGSSLGKYVYLVESNGVVSTIPTWLDQPSSTPVVAVSGGYIPGRGTMLKAIGPDGETHSTYTESGYTYWQFDAPSPNEAIGDIRDAVHATDSGRFQPFALAADGKLWRAVPPSPGYTPEWQEATGADASAGNSGFLHCEYISDLGRYILLLYIRDTLETKVMLSPYTDTQWKDTLSNARFCRVSGGAVDFLFFKAFPTDSDGPARLQVYRTTDFDTHAPGDSIELPYETDVAWAWFYHGKAYVGMMDGTQYVYDLNEGKFYSAVIPAGSETLDFVEMPLIDQLGPDLESMTMARMGNSIYVANLEETEE